MNLWETSLDKIIEDQFWLSKRSNISISESNEMAEFERSFYVDLLIKAVKSETEALNSLESMS